MDLITWFRGRRDRRRQAAEIQTMDRRELADIGLGREELLGFLRFPRDLNDRMRRMAAVFGADFARVERVRGLYTEAAHACGTCVQRDACARELWAEAGTSPERCSFCPNAATYARLAAARAA